jgi:hypothetical protein
VPYSAGSAIGDEVVRFAHSLDEFTKALPGWPGEVLEPERAISPAVFCMENRCVLSPAMTKIIRTAGREIAGCLAHPGDTAMISVDGDAARLDVGADEGHCTFEGCARPEDLGHPQRLQGCNILPGDGSAQNDQNIGRTPLFE